MRLAAWLVFGSAVAQAGEQPAPATAPPPTRLERILLAELDGELCLEALRELEFLGRARHVPAIAAKLDDERAAVRAAAATTLGNLTRHDPAAVPAVQAALRRALRDGSRKVQQAAIHAWPTVFAADTTDLVALLADQDVTMRASVAACLVLSGAAVDPLDVAAVLRDAAGTAAQRFVRPLFATLRDVQQVELLRPYMDADDADVRFRAREAAARLEAIAAGLPDDWRPASQRVREAGDALRASLTSWVHTRAWQEVAADEVLQRAAASRLVLFGEKHASSGPLRDAQRLVLRTMVAARRGRVVLGYEPSVQSAQRDVIDLARQLGVEAIPLETGWRQRVPEGRSWERDDEAAAIVNAQLAADPECRMLVVRGQNHTMPGGLMVRQLGVAPMIVLSTDCPPLEVFGDGTDMLGRTFRIGEGDVFWWCEHDWLWCGTPLGERLDAATVPAPTRLETSLLDLLEGDQQAGALRALADCGHARHVGKAAGGLGHALPEVRSAAVRALGAIAARDARAAAEVQDALQPALRDDDAGVHLAAVRAFPSRAGCEWRGLEVLLASKEVVTRLAAAGKLVQCGVTLHADHLAAALRDGVGSGHEALLLPLFGLADAAALRPYVDCSDSVVRERVRGLVQQLEAEAKGQKVDRFRDGERHGVDAMAATRALRRDWVEVTNAEVLREGVASRVVLFGDGARDRGALRTARVAVLRAMVAAAPGRVVLAADPAEDGVAEVMVAARELGSAVLELENGWRERSSTTVGDVLAARLIGEPASRMLVLCAAGHAIPRTWLSRQLPTEPCIVRTDELPPLYALGDRAATAQRTFRRGHGRVFAWIVDEVFADAGLAAWAAAWQPAPR